MAKATTARSGHFKKGYDPRRGPGRPKGSTNRFSVADLRRAITKVEERRKEAFMEAWIEAAWGDPKAMGNIANYMLPKLRAIEGVMGTDHRDWRRLHHTLRNNGILLFQRGYGD